MTCVEPGDVVSYEDTLNRGVEFRKEEQKGIARSAFSIKLLKYVRIDDIGEIPLFVYELNPGEFYQEHFNGSTLELVLKFPAKS